MNRDQQVIKTEKKSGDFFFLFLFFFCLWICNRRFTSPSAQSCALVKRNQEAIRASKFVLSTHRFTDGVMWRVRATSRLVLRSLSRPLPSARCLSGAYAHPPYPHQHPHPLQLARWMCHVHYIPKTMLFPTSATGRWALSSTLWSRMWIKRCFCHLFNLCLAEGVRFLLLYTTSSFFLCFIAGLGVTLLVIDRCL